ncbi:hypothetical protein D3C77_373160 [compost metagenome]
MASIGDVLAANLAGAFSDTRTVKLVNIPAKSARNRLGTINQMEGFINQLIKQPRRTPNGMYLRDRCLPSYNTSRFICFLVVPNVLS